MPKSWWVKGLIGGAVVWVGTLALFRAVLLLEAGRPAPKEAPAIMLFDEGISVVEMFRQLKEPEWEIQRLTLECALYRRAFQRHSRERTQP